MTCVWSCGKLHKEYEVKKTLAYAISSFEINHEGTLYEIAFFVVFILFEKSINYVGVSIESFKEALKC